MNAICYRYGPGCGYNDGQEGVSDVSGVVTRNRHFVNPSEGEGSVFWIS